MTTRNPRRGRPQAGTQAQRRDRVLDAALEQLIDSGYAATTMQAVATRASASKETLYSWFTDRDGLFASLIERSADTSIGALEAHFTDASTRDAVDAALRSYARSLLRLLTGEQSIALNRAAMSSERLAAILLKNGRHRAGPVVEDFLSRAHRSQILQAADPAEAFTELYGLIVQDTQIRVLLGEAPPTDSTLERRADRAIDQFLRLRGH